MKQSSSATTSAVRTPKLESSVARAGTRARAGLGEQGCSRWRRTFLDEMFQRHHGSGRTALDAAGIVNPVVRDFVSVRFQKDKTHITGTFMHAIERFELPAGFDRETDFEVLTVRPIEIDDFKQALCSPDFTDEWWVTVAVSHKLPLRRWAQGLRLTVTDENLLQEAERDRRRQLEAAVDSDVRRYDRARLREAGL